MVSEEGVAGRHARAVEAHEEAVEAVEIDEMEEGVSPERCLDKVDGSVLSPMQAAFHDPTSAIHDSLRRAA